MQDRADLVDRSDDSIGSVVTARRRNLGLTQNDLAALSSVSTRTVHAIEADKPTVRLDMLVTVLQTLGLRLAVTGPAHIDRPKRAE